MALQWKRPNNWSQAKFRYQSTRLPSRYTVSAGQANTPINFPSGQLLSWQFSLDTNNVVTVSLGISSDGWQTGTLGTATGIIPVAFRPYGTRSVQTTAMYYYYQGHTNLVVSFYVDFYANGNVVIRNPSVALGDVFGNQVFLRYQR